jgi:D-galactarolactone isomerase
MNNSKIGRRTFLHGISFAALGAVAKLDAQAQVAVPNSSGTELPKLKAPALACDCHHHIYDPARFAPSQPGVVPNARVQEYRLLQRRIGTTRNIVVTPRPYLTDNRVTLELLSLEVMREALPLFTPTSPTRNSKL